jgi:hypothetical protein
MVGAILGGFLFIFLALYGVNFGSIYFIIVICCIGIQLLSFWVFMTIDPTEYEFKRHLKEDN